jgi:hypothetical protein
VDSLHVKMEHVVGISFIRDIDLRNWTILGLCS